ncbi:MAG: hypothetical protein Q8K98_03285 [Bacteroidota bacterium]|nr:hypothetical protein [Bacteroidota bacterium]
MVDVDFHPHLRPFGGVYPAEGGTQGGMTAAFYLNASSATKNYV